MTCLYAPLTTFTRPKLLKLTTSETKATRPAKEAEIKILVQLIRSAPSLKAESTGGCTVRKVRVEAVVRLGLIVCVVATDKDAGNALLDDTGDDPVVDGLSFADAAR